MSIFSIKDRLYSRIGNTLLFRKTWNLLRYVHARNALQWMIESHYGDIKSVLVIGCGTGLSEISLALEFPHIHFTLTDWGGATHTTKQAKMFQDKFKIRNVSWSTLNILNPSEEKLYDLVYSVEVLEHIEMDQLAAQNMANLSNNYIFLLVPFAEEARNQNPILREKAFNSCEHYLCGYNPSRLFNLFPNIVNMSGCYWEAGLEFRKKITNMTKEELENKSFELFEEAKSDLINEIPRHHKDALGIKIISSKSEIQK